MFKQIGGIQSNVFDAAGLAILYPLIVYLTQASHHSLVSLHDSKVQQVHVEVQAGQIVEAGPVCHRPHAT